MPSGSRCGAGGRERRRRSWWAPAAGRLCWPERWPRLAAVRAAGGQLRAGAGGLASLVSAPGEFLSELSDRGVPLMTFGDTGTRPPASNELGQPITAAPTAGPGR